jgi:hypothetical protein
VTRAGTWLLMGVLSGAFTFVAIPGQATAKPAKKAAAAAKKAHPAPARATPRAAKEKSGGDANGGDDAGGDDDAGSSAPAETAAAPAAGGAKVKTKTYTFGAMDVEGKLKTPQLLYFLNRVKLELDMSAPDKRSFMKELQQSADDKNL